MARMLLAVCSLLVIAFSQQLHRVDAKCPSVPISLPDLVFLGSPDGCIKGRDGSQCDIFLRMEPNVDDETFIDFYMEGNRKGWVAVGFSEDKHMVLTDVVGCKQARNGSLGVINSWNPDVQPQKNVIDPSQDRMCNYGLKYEENRLKCHFGRYSGIINEGFDYDLDNAYYLILGHSDNQSPTNEAFPYHTVIPIPSVARFNVYDYNTNTSNGTGGNDAIFKEKMKKAHGSLMSIAWLLFASTGIFFAMWMKPAFSDGLWFQFHRALMIVAVVTEVAGFICIFIATRKNKTPGLIGFECPEETFHFVFGILATGAMLANPILGFLRCKPESPNRWIFNLSHGLLGTGSWLLALINIALGLALFQSPCGSGPSTGSYPMLQLYLGWLGYFVLAHILLFTVFVVFALRSHGSERYYLAPTIIKPILKRMDGFDYHSVNSGNDTDVSAKDAIIRKAAFGIYSAVNCIAVTILVVMIATNN